MTARIGQVVLVAIVAGFSQNPLIGQTQTHQGIVEVRAVFERLFRTLKEHGGKAGLDAIKEKFQPDDSSGKLLALKIDEMLATVGALEDHEYIGARAISPTHRYVDVAYLSYHKLSPVMWEATAYRREAGWIVLKLKFSTDNLIERASDYDAVSREGG